MITDELFERLDAFLASPRPKEDMGDDETRLKDLNDFSRLLHEIKNAKWPGWDRDEHPIQGFTADLTQHEWIGPFPPVIIPVLSMGTPELDLLTALMLIQIHKGDVLMQEAYALELLCERHQERIEETKGGSAGGCNED